MIKKILYSYCLFCTTQIICFITTYILLLISDNIQSANNSIEGLFYFSFYSFIIGGINTFFLITLYSLKINRQILTNIKACVTESVLFYILSVIIRLIISAIPKDIKFYYHNIIAHDGNIISSNAYTLKFWYTDEAQIIYVYTILFLFYVIKRIIYRNL